MLPTLYLTTKLGRPKQWSIQVDGNTLVRQDYFVGGKEKQPTRRQYSGTNEGKANERTPEEQAWFEAARCWIKQLDKGYQPAPDDPGRDIYQKICSLKEGGQTNHNLPLVLLQLYRGEDIPITTVRTTSTAPTVKPMLADKLQGKERHFQPQHERWYIQPKLDGVRCLAHCHSNGGDVQLLSRTGKALAHLQHVKQALAACKADIILDGELYTDHLEVDGRVVTSNEKFDKISGACRPVRGKPAAYEAQIQFHVFDIVNSQPQSERLQQLADLHLPPEITVVRTHPVSSRAEVDSWQASFLEQGYEGVILRKGEALYEQRRTVSLLKYKQFDDAEFSIVDALQGEGTEAGCVVWRCTTEQGTEFDVRPRGSFQQRQQLYREGARYRGKPLTVRYQGLSADGVPRFPVGVAIRDYE